MSAVTACFAGSSPPPITGASATATALAARCPSARYLHIATHGFFHEIRPRFSGLVLSRGGSVLDDGYLQLEEILALPLACDQVTLSACSTARGEQVTGEGVLGLTRAFLHAGARSVVAALWEVSGRETADLMADLYAGLAADSDPDRRHALAEAKRRQIAREGDGTADPAHPFFWAAFVLVGAPR
jgi:CHAT domain-containing protein